MKRRDLERSARAARKEADAADLDARAAKERARVLAEEACELEAQLDRVRWIDAQIELGVDEADIDVDRMLVVSLPAGPTHEDGS